jgi:hypothetical protein
MRDWVRADRRRLVLIAGIVALAVLGSGCSSAGTGSRPHQATMVAQDHRGGPVHVSWARAVALTHQMLMRLTLPPGARPVPSSALPVSQRWHPAAPPMAEVLQAYQLPQPVGQAFQDMLSHPPSGTLPGAISKAAPVTDRAVTYLLRTEPQGVFVAQLVVIVAPRQGGGSWLTTEAHVAVFLLSSAAERLNPAALHVVTIRVTGSHSARLVIRSAAVAGRLAALVNQMPPQIMYSSTPHSCPAITVGYRLDFATSASSPPAATVEADSCGIENVTVHGIPSGPREDRDGKLLQAVSQLLPA